MVNKIGEQVELKLKELADEKYREFHSNLCQNSKKIILGVRVPVLRNYAKELYSKYSMQELKNINENYYEEIMLKGMFIGLQKDIDIEEAFYQIKEFVPKIDNWAVCDTFCAGLKITKKYKEEMYNFVKKYLGSKEEFELRFAVVMLLDYYIDEKHIKEVLKLLDNVKHDGYYVKMAVAWAVSICIIKYYDITIEYLKKCKLDNFTYNKALQKAIESFRIDNNKKNILRTIKKY